MVTRQRLGIAVLPNRLEVVALRGGRVRQRAGADVGQEEGVAGALRSLLKGLGDVAAARANVALSDDAVRVRPLHGLANLRTKRIASEAAAMNPDRYFVGSDGGLLVSPASWGTGGSWYAAAFDADRIVEIESVCREHQVLVDLVCAGPDCYPADMRAYVRGIEDVARFAATATSRTPFTMGTGQRLLREQRTRRWLRVTAGIAVAFSVALYAAAPLMAASGSFRERLASFDSLTNLGASVDRDLTDLGHVSRTLAHVDRISTRASSMLERLSSLAAALPDSTAITSARLDSVGITLAVVTSDPSRALERIALIAGVELPQLVGPVARERHDDVELQRFTASMRLHRPTTRSPR